MLRDDTPRRGPHTVTEQRVEALLSAAAAPSEPGPLPGEREALAAFRTIQTAPRRRRSTHRTSIRVAVATLGAGVLLSGGVAAAVTGALPGAAQGTAQSWLEQLGVTVPGVDDSAVADGAERGSAGADETDGAPADRPESAAKGTVVSELARETAAVGAEKGAAVSELASDGRSRAADDHPDKPAGSGRASDSHAVTGHAPSGQANAGTRAPVDVANHGAAANTQPGETHTKPGD